MTRTNNFLRLSFAAVALLALAGCNSAGKLKDTRYNNLQKAAEAGKPGTRAIAINERQGSAYIDDRVYKDLNKDNARVEISLSEQRARVYAGSYLAIDTPISTGVGSYPTPAGMYTIMDKKTHHRSNLYGDYVDADGNVVLRGVSSRTTKAPAGTSWRGTAMPYWQRLTSDGIGLHVGYVPGWPASHGCLRFPSQVMPMIFAKTKVGTPVSVY